MKNNTLLNMNTNGKVLWMALLMALLLGNGQTLLAHPGHHHVHEHQEGNRPSLPDTVELDLYYGNIRFTDSKVYYYTTVGGTEQSIDRPDNGADQVYIISQYNNSTPTSHTISVGTPVTYNNVSWTSGCETAGTIVTKETIIYLNGINISVTSTSAVPIMVNNKTNTVYLILMDDTTNTCDINVQENHHAAIEKELYSIYNQSDGYLVITCVDGYAAYNSTTHTGGCTCSETGHCGRLYAYSAKANYDTYGMGSGGAPGIGCVCAYIHSSGIISGVHDPATFTTTAYRTLKNLVIAGGRIEAKGSYCSSHMGNSWGAPGIGLGSSRAADSNEPTGPALENLRITGGRIKSMSSSSSSANIGGAYRSATVDINISGGYIDATEWWNTGTGNNVGKAAGIGAGAGGTQSGSVGHAHIDISGGTILATSHWGAAIGGASGGDGTGSAYATSSSGATITISGGNITATTTATGAAIGSGGLFATGTNTGKTGYADITISGGTIVASSDQGADIGTGGQVHTGTGRNAGKAEVRISGGDVTANTGGIGGGHAVGGTGGEAYVKVTGGIVKGTSIGGGNSKTSYGGAATVRIGGTADVRLSVGIGGGDTETGTGGNASIIVTGGSMKCGSIGGGDASGTGGNGGNASIYVTGGTLDCASIGGGNTIAGSGNPGSVAPSDSTANSYNAGIYIVHATNDITVKSGYIGGGTNPDGSKIGFATAHIDAPNAKIQGQFVLANSESSRHCFFTLNNGIINNVHLGESGYPRLKADGGAVFMTDPHGAVVDINGGTIKRSGGDKGGAIFMEAGTCTISGTALIDSCYTTSGTDIGLGGGVYMGGGTFNMSGGTMQRCMAPDKGGAVYLASGTVNMSGGTIGGSAANTNMNTAVNAGGGIYMAGGSFTMTGGNLQYNKVTATGAGDGGGVYVAGTASITGGNITGNVATRNGGGFYVNPGAGITTNINSSSANTVISINSAVLGGGAYINSGTLAISGANTTIKNNTATSNGGGAYVANGSVTVANATIGGTSSTDDGNTAGGHGGGLYVAGSFTLNSGNIKYNKAEGTGTDHDGGGVYVADGGSATINGGSITGNTAERNGGGFYVNPGTSGSTPIKSTSAAITINGNSAVLGGGAYIASGTVEVQEQSSNAINIHSNTATANGGGFYLLNGTFNLKSGTLGGSAANTNMNTASGNGGGLYMAGGRFNMTGGNLQYNKANTYDGGGVYIATGGVANITGGIIKDNVANRYGGGFYVDPGSSGNTPINSLSTNTQINGNSAVLGGGAYINSGTVTLSQPANTLTVFGNTASDKGGGIYLAAGTFNLQGGRVGGSSSEPGNQAHNSGSTGKGGGLYLANGTFNLSGGTLGGDDDTATGMNQADDDGGGLYLAAGTFEMTGGKLQYNKATGGDGGGVYVYIGGHAGIHGGSITGNTAPAGNGGGFYVDPGAAITTPINSSVANLVINDNSAVLGGGGYIASGTVNLSESSDRTTRIFGNYATNNGGGIYMAAGSFNLGSGTVGADELANGNVAANNGGGIYVNKTGETPSTFNMTGGSVKYNKTNAQDGGGVYVYNGGVANIHGGTIQGNQAYRNGGGFYVNPGAGFTTTINSTVAATEISGNSAVKGGGAYVASGTVELSDGVSETTSVINNAASSDGGGVYVAGGDFTMSSGTFSSNTAVDGGGVYVSSGAVTVTGGTFDGNKAISSTGGHGGGIYAGGGSVSFKSATLSNNVTVDPDDDDDYNGFGGGIYTTGTGTTVTLDKTSLGSAAELYGNKAKQGGAVFGGATVSEGNAVTVNHAYIGGTGSGQANTAAESGGGIYASGSVELGDGAVVQCNSAADGGGAYVSGGSLTMSTGTTAPVIKKNSASQDGGGAYVNGGAFTMNAGTIGGAVADANQATRNGGGVYVTGSGASVAVNSGCTVSYNTAGTSGGGVYAAQGDVALASATLSNNTATAGNGGGAYVMGNATVTGSTLENNSAPATTDGNGMGGAVYVGEGGTFILDGSTVASNTAGKFGGGFYVDPDDAEAVTLVRNKSYIYDNHADKGGGAYVASGKLKVKTATGTKDDPTRINENVASTEGGGVFVSGGNVEVIEATMHGNTATGNGGAIYASGGSVTLTRSTLSNNSSTGGNGGGIYAQGGAVFSNGSTLTYNTALAGDGGGAYANGGNITVQKESATASSLTYNRAINGGAIYATGGGSVVLIVATVDNNSATTGDGGAVYAATGGSVTSNGSTISNNTASAGDGGGIYANGGTIRVQQKGNATASSLTSNSANNGGALYAAGGSVYLYNASVTGNHATTGNGGAMCAAFTGVGSVTIGGGTIDSNQTDNSSSDGLGGAIYVSGDDGTVYIQDSANVAPVFTNNSARNGGVLYMAGGTCNLTAGDLGVVDDPEVPAVGTGNTASRRGGGIYAEGGTINFSNGNIKYNSADIEGGGIYLAESGTINLMLTAVIDYNHVPDGQNGGGVYMDGILNVGQNYDDSDGTHKVIAEHNYTGTTYSGDKLNNIYLKDETDVITLKSSISHQTNGFYDSHIGFSVNSGFRPVVGVARTGYHTSGSDIVEERWLNSLLMSEGEVLNSAIFDDTHSYIAIHVPTDNDLFEWNYIYLWSGWNTGVDVNPGTTSIQPEGDPTDPTFDPDCAVYHIKDAEGLSWFSSMVNGLNGNTAHPYISGILDADVDMAAYLWIPIGGVQADSYHGENVQSMSSIFQPGGEFHGTFDGQGHTISNIECRYIVNVSEYGLFGNLIGAQVKNVFVDGFLYETQSNDIEYHIGGIAGTADGSTVVSNCEAQGVIDARFCKHGSLVGGLVGKMTTTNNQSPTIHSGMALTDIKGKATYIGGLAGKMGENTSIKNSFANTVVDVTTTNAQHVGGLASKNSGGTLSNCYSLLRAGEGGSGYYGIGNQYGSLVAQNMDCDYVRITSLEDLTDGSQVILAARYNETPNAYLGINNTVSASGRVVNTPFASTTNSTEEVAREILLAEDAYYWTVHVSGGNYTFTNSNGATIGYMSDTLFTIDGAATQWTIARTTSGGIAMVPDYTGFTITNVNTSSRGLAIHTKNGVKYFGAYETTNNNNEAYNFYFDIFKKGTTPIDGTVEYSYAYYDGSEPSTIVYTEDHKEGTLVEHGYFTPTGLTNGKYGFLYDGQQVHLAKSTANPKYVTPTTNGPMEFTNDGDYILKGLLVALNAWATEHKNDALVDGTHYSQWTRTMGSPINEDYPVLKFNDFACLGSKTGSRYIDYKKDVTTAKTTTTYGLNAMITEYNLTTDGGAIYPYVGRPEITVTTEDNVRVYLEPKMILKQALGVKTNAHVGIVFDNSLSPAEAIALAGQPYDWHMFATPLMNAPLGLTYHSTYGDVDEPQYPSGASYTPAFNRIPPQVTIEAGCYFPSDTPYGYPYTTDDSFDFYCYDEHSRHWINFKRASNDHWHADALWDGVNHQIMYENETNLVNGKGYLLAVSQPTLLSADGILRNIDFIYKPDYSEEGDYGGVYYEALAGINLVGNPYYAYLDFDEFARENHDSNYQTYYILDADKKGYIAYTYNSTPSEDHAPRYISPHQGFFIKASSEKTDINFTTDMKRTRKEVATDADSVYYYFRGEPAGYPLVNLVTTDSKGMCEYATIELNRPELGGGEKLMMRTGTASMYFHIEDTDYQIAFVPECVKSAPVRFEVIEDDTYTFTWTTANANFTYLHLIDNIAGMDIDCLTHSEYKFEGHTTDYKSRFRLEFEYETDEPEEDDDENAPFAFMMGDELVVNGEGVLQVFDIMGRQIMGRELQGIQSTVALPSVADGVYILRFNTGSVTKTQKLVINK